MKTVLNAFVFIAVGCVLGIWVWPRLHLPLGKLVTITKRPDPKLADVRSAAAELRGAVEIGVTYPQYMEKMQHLAAAISLAEQSGDETAKYKEALGYYRSAFAVWGTKINTCNEYSVEHVPGIFENCRDAIKVSATFAGIQSQLPKKIREADLPPIYDAIIQTYFKKAGDELNELEGNSTHPN